MVPRNLFAFPVQGRLADRSMLVRSHALPLQNIDSWQKLHAHHDLPRQVHPPWLTKYKLDCILMRPRCIFMQVQKISQEPRVRVGLETIQ